MAFSRLILAAVVLLTPSAATAGPIEWEAVAELARVGGSFGPSAGWLPPEFIGGGNTIHEQSFSRLASAGPVHGWGWKSAVIGAVVPDGPRLDPTNWAEQTFGVKLTLTDRASGQAGTLTFAATGGERLIQDYDNPFSGFLLGRTSYAAISGDTDQTITLGGREYHVGLSVRERADEAELIADVRVGPAPATPEPATLALAGLGLGVAALRRRVSRRLPRALARVQASAG